MVNITIRPAAKEDCARMLELVHELAEFEKAPQKVTVSPEHFTESGFGADPVWWAFVAEVPAETKGDKKIVAFALYYIRYSTWKGQRMYLEDIIVTKSWRGKGIGSLLMDRLVQEAKERKFTGMMWQVLDWNEPAKAFYKKYNAGFDSEWVNCNMDFDG